MGLKRGIRRLPSLIWGFGKGEKKKRRRPRSRRRSRSFGLRSWGFYRFVLCLGVKTFHTEKWEAERGRTLSSFSIFFPSFFSFLTYMHVGFGSVRVYPITINRKDAYWLGPGRSCWGCDLVGLSKTWNDMADGLNQPEIGIGLGLPWVRSGFWNRCGFLLDPNLGISFSFFFHTSCS